MRIITTARFALALSCAVPAIAAAQENYEIQVYPSETTKKGTTVFELHSNFTGSGTTARTGSLLATNGAFHETLEITHGFSDIFEVGFYVFTSDRGADGYRFVGTHIRPRIRAPESWKLPVGLSLSTEFGPTNKAFDESELGVEFRPIIDQTIGKFYWSINPTIGWSVKGPEAGKGLDGMMFAPAVKLQWELNDKVSAGIEYYGGTGSLKRMAAAADQSHMIYPTLDFDLGPEWELNVGYGVLAAGGGDHNIFKVIFGRRVGW